ncbi:Phosphoglycerate dehydrogenase [Lentzea waywayandensis]|uniref:Phosphoglycerate dehydrogenase n=1 Tax=Lentzea waywayandensis TaxID=84724 RepID=A0A1I6FG17_9PSEU|nr:2-hydroxyacid dehydrogenase [Lentzea waywayandensis]SFR28727.1 Phosphoglycerate dehydrogenase [Lentzea waywayandensis]
MITVWLPEHESEELMGGLPEGVRADVWTGGALPSSQGEVEIVIPPFDVEEGGLAVLSDLPRLKLVQLESVGVDWVLPYLPDGVALCNARGAYDAAVAEWVVATVLTRLRELPRFALAQQEGRWDYAHSDSLEGKTVLVVGYGSIGRTLAGVLKVFGANVIGVASRARDGVRGADELPDLVPQADIVVLLAPATARTRGMVDAEFLKRMHDGAMLVNAGRGALVDTEALTAELNSGRLFAALDVTDPEPLPEGHPLWSAPGLVLTPHVAGSNGTPMAKAMALAKAQFVRYANGEPLVNVIGPDGY